MNKPRDLQLTDDGKWEPYDVFAAAPDPDNVPNVGAYLESQGWSGFTTLSAGLDWSSLSLVVWQRDHDGRAEYLISVESELAGSSYMKVNNLPTLMDLLARWAPAVQAATIADVVRDLQEPGIEYNGIVETVAGRAAWGVQDRLPELRSARREQDAAARKRAADRRRAAE